MLHFVLKFQRESYKCWNKLTQNQCWL